MTRNKILKMLTRYLTIAVLTACNVYFIIITVKAYQQAVNKPVYSVAESLSPVEPFSIHFLQQGLFNLTTLHLADTSNDTITYYVNGSWTESKGCVRFSLRPQQMSLLFTETPFVICGLGQSGSWGWRVQQERTYFLNQTNSIQYQLDSWPLRAKCPFDSRSPTVQYCFIVDPLYASNIQRTRTEALTFTWISALGNIIAVIGASGRLLDYLFPWTAKIRHQYMCRCSREYRELGDASEQDIETDDRSEPLKMHQYIRHGT